MKVNSKYFNNQYFYINKNKIYALILLFLITFISVGYAYLNSMLNINGTLKVNKNIWNVHFENIIKKQGSATATSEAIITNETEINFTVELQKPGDFYSFTTDVVNSGTIDAMLGEILKTGLTTEQEKYIDYIVTYSDGKEILVKDSLPSNESDTLLITVKYKDDVPVEQLPTEDQSIILKLNMEYVQADNTRNNRRPVIYVFEKVLKQNKEDGKIVLDKESSTFVSSSTGIDFLLPPSDTNGKGVYIKSGTENDPYPIYYYRGEVDNNNIIFAGFCWKIVRTTETGGTKLIYNGIPFNGTCNNTGDASHIGESVFNESEAYNAYVGYMYGTPNSATYEEEHKNTNESAVKKYIDSWYEANMTKYTSFLEDTVWCNDRSFSSTNTGDGTGTSKTYYAAYERNYSAANPSLECINLNDRFTVDKTMEGRIDGNDSLDYPVGLLTADEFTLAGQGYKGYSKTNYLYTGKASWTLSPTYYSSHARNLNLNASNYLFNNYVDKSYGIRPSVSLKNNALIIDGKGTVNDPYIVDCGEYKIKLETNYDIVLNKKMSLANEKITLASSEYVIKSFKVNGQLVTGTSFTMPESDVVITDITMFDDSEITVFESEHNPYPYNLTEALYAEKTFEGAKSLVVLLEYETEANERDWVGIYDSADSTIPVNNKKYSGARSFDIIEINGNYLKILFTTDGTSSNFYGFKAKVAAHY